MDMNVSPGATVEIKVTKTPTSERAAKTLSRIFAKDMASKRLARRRHRILAQTAERRRRGGRLWTVKSHAPRLIQPRAGDACRILASVDVIPDLASVKRFIEVSAV